MDNTKRTEYIEKIMNEVYDNIVGLPLMETLKGYAKQKNILWEPSLDGLLLIKDIK